MRIDRDVFFDWVRDDPFPGKLTGEQVEGMERLLDAWEEFYGDWDQRWLAYGLATSAHETGMRMTPVEEIGKGEGKEYGEPDPETGQTYYGRGDIQCTWRENYARLDKELGLSGKESCEWHAQNALDPIVSARALFQGMAWGWYREGETLGKYFNDVDNNPYEAREIVNGDKNYTPDWADGLSIGTLITNYHVAFLNALEAAYAADTATQPRTVTVIITAPPGVRVDVHVREED